MEKENRIFPVEDIYKAFNLGIGTGLYALEKSIELPTEDQEYLLECLKRMVSRKSDH